MTIYSVRYIHKITPKDTDVGPDIELSNSSMRTLAAKLRELKILAKGQRCKYRTEIDGKIVIFPSGSVWHSIVLTKKAP